MKKWKKWTALLCAGAMLVSLTACGTQTAGYDSMADYAGQSVTGQITALYGTYVTLQIGELSQSDDIQPSDATPPEKPEGDATGETTEQTTGAQPSDMTLPDKPEGDDSAAMDGSALPDGQTPPDALPGGQTFTAGTQTLTGDISVDAISSLQMRLCSGAVRGPDRRAAGRHDARWPGRRAGRRRRTSRHTAPRRARRRACRTCGWCTGRHKYLNFPAKALRFAGLGRRRSAFFAFLPWTVAFARWICYTVSCTTLGERKNGRTTEKEKYIFRQARFCIGGSGRIGRAGQYMAIPVSRGKVWRRDLFARLYYPGADLWLFHDRR